MKYTVFTVKPWTILLDHYNYCYGGNVERFGGPPPEALYDDNGQAGKDTASGLEQQTFENLGKLNGTANKRNTVDQGNAKEQTI